MAVVDASVWVALYQEDDKFHKHAENIIQSLLSTQERITIPAIAVSEVAAAMKRTVNSDTASKSGHHMKSIMPEILVDFAKLEPIATDIAIHYGVKGMAAYYLAVAELTKSRLYTFDMQQAEAFETISRKW